MSSNFRRMSSMTKRLQARRTRLKFNFVDLFLPTGPAHDPARLGAGMFAVFQDLFAVYENMDHAGRVLVGLFIRRIIANRIRIENDYIGVISLLKLSPPVELEILRRQPC